MVNLTSYDEGGIVAVTAILLVGPLYVENFPIDVYGIGDQILVQFTNVFPPDELTVQEQQENAEINVMFEDVLGLSNSPPNNKD